MILIGNSIFVAIPFEAHLIYLLGATAFTFGSRASELLRVGNPLAVYLKEDEYTVPYRIVIFLLIVIAALTPFFINRFYGDLSAENYATFLSEIRQDDIVSADEGGKQFDLLKNFGIISFFLSMSLYYLNDGFKRQPLIMACLIIITLLFNFAGGSKQIIVMLPFTLFFLSAIRKGKLYLKRLAVLTVVVFLLFLILFYVINMQYEADSILDAFDNSFLILAGYTSGGLVSFGQVVQNPNLFENNQTIWRFFVETANSLGANIPILSRHARYTYITSQDTTNIYSIYYSYYMDYGLLGVILLMFLLGAILGWVYRQAKQGELLCTFFYARFCIGIILSLQSERFFDGLNNYIKQLIFLLVVFWLPMTMKRIASRPVRSTYA